MATSDGIQDSDWEDVMDLAAAVANQTGINLDASLIKKRLLRSLDKLERKYGRLPTILSTKADYIDDLDTRLSLLKEAYVTACEASDVQNKVFISSSLAEIYLDCFESKAKASFWVGILKTNIEDYPDDDYFNELLLKLSHRLDEWP